MTLCPNLRHCRKVRYPERIEPLLIRNQDVAPGKPTVTELNFLKVYVQRERRRRSRASYGNAPESRHVEPISDAARNRRARYAQIFTIQVNGTTRACQHFTKQLNISSQPAAVVPSNDIDRSLHISEQPMLCWQFTQTLTRQPKTAGALGQMLHRGGSAPARRHRTLRATAVQRALASRRSNPEHNQLRCG